MLIEIIKHTPMYVFAIFFGLLWLGWTQSRARVVPVKRAVGISLAMMVLSLAGVLSAFHGAAMGVGAWGVALILGVGAGVLLQIPRGIQPDASPSAVMIPGSWVPLGLMMSIFVTKYAVGFSLAQNPALAGAASFVVVASAIYGLMSGLFLARAIAVLRVVRQAPRLVMA